MSGEAGSDVLAALGSVTLDGDAAGSSAALHKLHGPSAAESGTVALEEEGCFDDSWTCAICLDPIAFEDLAVVKGCDHTYCVNCILNWACVKERNCCCPTCKAPFSSLYVHRQLDGTLTDFEVEESVCLLMRAAWFQNWLKSHEKVADLYKYSVFRSASAAERNFLPEATRDDWAEDALYQYFEDEYDDDEVEEYYFSAQAGSNRITLGNRPFGPNGYMRSGHRCARPSSSNAPRPPKNASKVRAGAAGAQVKLAAAHGGGASGGSGAAAASGGSSSKAQGRRARRNARRLTEDASDD